MASPQKWQNVEQATVEDSVQIWPSKVKSVIDLTCQVWSWSKTNSAC